MRKKYKNIFSITSKNSPTTNILLLASRFLKLHQLKKEFFVYSNGLLLERRSLKRLTHIHKLIFPKFVIMENQRGDYGKKQNEGRILFRLIKYFLPIIFLYFVSCEDNGVEPINPEGICPLKPGSGWLYKITHPSWMKDTTLKIEITGTMTVTYRGQNYTVAKMAFYDIGESMPEYQWFYWKGSD